MRSSRHIGILECQFSSSFRRRHLISIVIRHPEAFFWLDECTGAVRFACQIFVNEAKKLFHT